MTSDQLLNFGGWNIDDFKLIVANPDLTAVPNETPAKIILAVSAQPNPFTPNTRLQLSIPPGVTKASLEIYDTTGRVVRTLHQGAITPGILNFDWDGLNSAQQPVPAGTYYCRANAGEQTVTTKLIRIQ